MKRQIIEWNGAENLPKSKEAVLVRFDDGSVKCIKSEELTTEEAKKVVSWARVPDPDEGMPEEIISRLKQQIKVNIECDEDHQVDPYRQNYGIRQAYNTLKGWMNGDEFQNEAFRSGIYIHSGGATFAEFKAAARRSSISVVPICKEIVDMIRAAGGNEDDALEFYTAEGERCIYLDEKVGNIIRAVMEQDMKEKGILADDEELEPMDHPDDDLNEE